MQKEVSKVMIPSFYQKSDKRLSGGDTQSDYLCFKKRNEARQQKQVPKKKRKKHTPRW